MSNDIIKQENIWQENPWDVSNIQEFLFYNCPECDIRLKDGKMFMQHALENHELSKLYLNKPIEEILPPDYKEIMRQEARDRMALQNYLNRGGPLTEYEGGPLKEYVEVPPVVKHEVDPLALVKKCRCNICSLTFQTTLYSFLLIANMMTNFHWSFENHSKNS